ncbi:HNH endonuclease signature motif containing protein [Spirillospora sp. NPDC048911]|uniref:HNH endonuclease signature motif containing protein n=1 Tax=Spirillospora sp. NPDC048911 TaxID=3364527 RepID=UPI00371BF102
MVAPKFREEDVYPAVLLGDLEIDSQGRVWRVAARRGDRWTGEVRVIPCARRRAENVTGKYLQVRVMFDGIRYHALAHRLVWKHFVGPIPEGLTINHKNGRQQDNRPSNLELATPKEQARHARDVLRRGRLDQYGERNAMAKLSTEQVREICSRRASGEALQSIADHFGVRMQHISRIARGDRRSLG